MIRFECQPAVRDSSGVMVEVRHAEGRMPNRRSLGILLSVLLTGAACVTSDEPTALSLCLDAVGELQGATQEYYMLLEAGVEQMRDEDAVERLVLLSEQYARLLDDLNAREGTLPGAVERAHGLLASGVGMQVSAWMSIGDGLQFQDGDLILDGAEMIALSRDLVSESQLAIPDCSRVGN